MNRDDTILSITDEDDENGEILALRYIKDIQRRLINMIMDENVTVTLSDDIEGNLLYCNFEDAEMLSDAFYEAQKEAITDWTWAEDNSEEFLRLLNAED